MEESETGMSGGASETIRSMVEHSLAKWRRQTPMRSEPLSAGSYESDASRNPFSAKLFAVSEFSDLLETVSAYESD